jgi:hypothetical protein
VGAGARAAIRLLEELGAQAAWACAKRSTSRPAARCE